MINFSYLGRSPIGVSFLHTWINSTKMLYLFYPARGYQTEIHPIQMGKIGHRLLIGVVIKTFRFAWKGFPYFFLRIYQTRLWFAPVRSLFTKISGRRSQESEVRSQESEVRRAKGNQKVIRIEDQRAEGGRTMNIEHRTSNVQHRMVNQKTEVGRILNSGFWILSPISISFRQSLISLTRHKETVSQLNFDTV
jgi:hypothetical protein